MRLLFGLTLSPWKVRISGLFALIAIVGILTLPQFLASEIDEKKAVKEIRDYLQRQQSYQQLEELEATGRESPDLGMAQRWESQMSGIEQIEFISTEVNRFILVPPFSSYRMFVVKAVMRSESEPEQTRYFTLSSRSKFFEVFWVAEHSWFFWLLSV